MWEKLRVVFTIPELRQKIFLTLFLLAVYRVGYWISLPMVDQAKLTPVGDGTGGLANIINQVAVFSASDLTQATIFGLGIMPYISASIIFQLLGSVWKPIEELKKEGETGRKKINEYTRYLTVVLCLIQSYFYVKFWLLASVARWRQPDCRGVPQRGWHTGLGLAADRRVDHDLRHNLPDVDRRTDRRVRDRQRHQLVDHGRHSGPHAQRPV